MASDLDRLNRYKAQVEKAKQDKANLEGRQESLMEQAVKVKETMETEFGAKTLSALEKSIAKQKALVEGMSTDLEAVFGE